MTLAAPPSARAGLAALRERFPWPNDQPYPAATPVGRHSSGFDLITRAIYERGAPTVVMEIGSEFGGSTRRFLEDPTTFVVSVDPWPDSYGYGSFPDLQQFIGVKDAMFDLFRSFCWEQRDRIVALREFSPAGPLIVRDAGVSVDVVYIDGDHRYDAVVRDLTISDALFPNAVLCGDDWSLKSNHSKYEGMRVPVRRAVQSWAAFHDVHVEFEGNTWMLDKSKPYNLERPPARFVDTDSVVEDLSERVRRIEMAVTAKTFSQRLERKVRTIWKRVQEKVAGRRSPGQHVQH